MDEKYPKIDMYRTGQNMKRIMQKRGLTVRDVQEYLGLATSQSIYHWFEGHNLPSLDNLYALSKLFHVTMDEMICGNRQEKVCDMKDTWYERIVRYYRKWREIRIG